MLNPSTKVYFQIKSIQTDMEKFLIMDKNFYSYLSD